MLHLTRVFFAVIFLLSIFNDVCAQTEFGAFAGLNRSRLYGDVPRNAKYRAYSGLSAGLLIDFKLGQYIALSIQPTYSQEGSKVFYSVVGELDPIDSIHIRLTYFSIPILFKVVSDNNKFYALSGVEPAYLYDSYQKSKGVKSELNSHVNEFNLVIQFGAGLRYPLQRGFIFFELRYTQGIFNLTDEPIDKSIIPRIKTSGYRFITGFSIPLSNTNAK